MTTGEIILAIGLLLAIIILAFLNRNRKIAKLREMNEKYKHDLVGPF